MCFSSLDIDFFVRSGLKGIRLFQLVRFLKNSNMKNAGAIVLFRVFISIFLKEIPSVFNTVPPARILFS